MDINRLFIPKLFLLFLSIISVNSVWSQNPVCATPGSDGVQEFPAPQNSFFPGAGDDITVSSGATSFNLDPIPDPFEVGGVVYDFGNNQISKGDLLLIIQIQGATINYANTAAYGSGNVANNGSGYINLNNVGRYEYMVALNDVSPTGGTLQFKASGAGGGLLYTYENKPATALQIIKEVDSSMSLIGDEVVFTLTAYNAGPQNATGVTVQDILPLGFTYVSTSGAYDANSGIWTVGNLNSGASTTLTITAIINPTGSHYNQATISGTQFDPDLNNNSSGIEVYPMYPMTEITLPCATINYDLSTFNIGTPPPGAEISWHTATPADDSNRVATPTNTQAGRTYYVAYYDPVQNCYGSTSVVKIIRSCLITNPMIRQRVK